MLKDTTFEISKQIPIEMQERTFKTLLWKMPDSWPIYQLIVYVVWEHDLQVKNREMWCACSFLEHLWKLFWKITINI